MQIRADIPGRPPQVPASAGIPAVTVLMACRDAENFLREAVDSILAQTFRDFEFLIVDDGSTDATPAILAGYAALDSRIRLITLAPSGLARALNRGILEARAPWTARMDADDVAEPRRLELQMARAARDPDLILVGTGAVLVDGRGRPMGTRAYPRTHRGLVRRLERALAFPPHASILYRTQAVRQAGGYRPRIGRAEDADLWLRLSRLGRLACVRKPLVRIRKHPGQVSLDRAGRSQVTDSRTALTGYWVRRLGGTDPVNGDDHEFHGFRAWVEHALEQEGWFAVKDLQFRFQAQAANGLTLPARLVRAAAALACLPGPFLGYLKWRLLGDRLPRRLARQWLGRHTETQRTIP